MPKRIGKYEITAEIGRGGYSRVYRGFDPSVNRPVAIKVSTRESDPEHLSRFRNEASAAGNLRHENIVTIHDYGDDDGVPYLVMELLEGRDLHHIMRDGPKLSLIEKMQIMSQVAEGLNCAHLNGIVHRDIKPANVMVLTDSTVKILDFGIARMTGEVSRLTQSGYLVGTPLYMSPEQLNGGDADVLCDVWAYGVLYFELLTGQHPFLSQDNARLVRNIQIVNPPSVHALTRGVPEGLAQVIRRALSKDRRRRYQSMEEVLVDTNPIMGLLQREQTAGLVSEAEFYRSSGQLQAARQTSRRALEIDPSNFGAQQLLKSIQNEMTEESLAVPAAVVTPPPPPTKRAELLPVVPPPPAPAAEPVQTPASMPAQPIAAPVPQAAPAVMEPAAQALRPPAAEIVPPPPPPRIEPAAAPIVSAAPVASAVATPPPTPAAAASAVPPPPRTQGPPTTDKFRMGAGQVSGAAAAIAAAVAAAKARQAEEERQQLDRDRENQTKEPPIKAAPLTVASPAPSRVVPQPAPTASFTRPDTGSSVFVTGEPLVVKRPAASVMTQRVKASEAEAEAAAVETPAPAPSTITRLPGAKAIPATGRFREANGNGEAAAPTTNGRKATSENLPMRRPPSEVYAKGRRKSSGTLFQEKKQRKPFPWAVALFVIATAIAGGAVVLFSISSHKYVSTPTLLPDKLSFTWKRGGQPADVEKITVKGGPNGAVYAASTDQDWLVVNPDTDDASNRSWSVKIDPDKLASNAPGSTTAWIDVTSTSNDFKSLAEVTLKVLPADPALKGNKKGPAKGDKKAGATPDQTAAAATPAADSDVAITTVTKPGAGTKNPAPASSTSTTAAAPGTSSPTPKPATAAPKQTPKATSTVSTAKQPDSTTPPNAKPAATVKAAEKAPAAKKKASDDGIDVNE